MNLRYDRGREAFGEAEIDWVSDEIVAYLVSVDYKASERHRTVNDLSGVVSGPVALEKKTITDGYAFADTVVFEAVSDGAMVAALVLAKRNAALIAYIGDVIGFPMRASGGDVLVRLPETTPFFFRL